MEKITILYDNQIFASQRFGGISNYFVQMMKYLPRNTIIKLPHMYSNNVYLKELSLDVNDLLPKLTFKGKGKVRNLINKLSNIKSILLSSYDIFHPTYYDDYFLKILPKKSKLVVTVYDMIHELFPQYFEQSGLEYITKRKLCQRADKIIAISEQTKNDLIKLFAIPEDKISVIYLSTDFKIVDTPLQEISWLPERYILFVGTRSGYKNFDWMLSALAIILKQLNIKLVVIGNPLTDTEQSLVNELGVTDLVIVNNVNSTKELQEIYNRASLFIFPSLYEGFGIPILEGFASKVPVLLTNTSCFPEIAQDAAAYFEPNNINDFQDKVNLILNSNDYSNNLIAKGVKRLEDFSWEKTSKETYELYKELIKNKPLPSKKFNNE